MQPPRRLLWGGEAILFSLLAAFGGAALVAFSFMVYNAAKALLGMAAIVFGMARMNAGSKVLGGATAALGAIALLSNAIVMVAGIDGFFPRPVAGGTGVVATLLLGLSLLSVLEED